MTKKLLTTLLSVLVITTSCFATISFAETTDSDISSEALDLENAVLVSEGERPDIYDIDLSEALDKDLFEDALSNDSLSLMATNKYRMEFQSERDALKIADGVLSGDVTTTLTATEAVDGVLYLGIYEKKHLVAVYAKNVRQEVGDYQYTFSDINVRLSSEAYRCKLYLMDKNLTPLGQAYAFNSSSNAKGVVFADGADVSPNAPIYYGNGKLSADINVFSGLGAVLQYDSDNNVLWIRKNNVKVGMYVNDNVLYVFEGNDRYTVTCDTGSFVQNNCIYVPVTDICGVFGFEVVYKESTEQVFLYSNEVLEAAYSSRFNADSEAGSYRTSIPTRDYCSAQINNGLTYFTAMGEHYIYVTDGSQLMKYDVGSYPTYVLSEGDYIYYTATPDHSNTVLMKLDKNTGIKTELSYSGELNGISYYNGELYLNGTGKVRDLQSGKITYSPRIAFGSSDCYDRALFPLNRDTLCDISAEFTSKQTTVIVNVANKETGKVLSKQVYSYDTTSNKTWRNLYAKHIGNAVYLRVNSLTGTENIAKITLNNDFEISSVSSMTATQLEEVWGLEEHTQSNFATTRTTNTYRFWQEDTLVKAENRTTGETMTLKDLSYRCNKFLFADDTCYIYCVYGITRKVTDGKYIYRYNGECSVYLVYYSGESVKLYAT